MSSMKARLSAEEIWYDAFESWLYDGVKREAEDALSSEISFAERE